MKNYIAFGLLFESFWFKTLLVSCMRGVYVMCNFTVIRNSGVRRLTTHRFRLLFKYTTNVTTAVPFVISNSGLSICAVDKVFRNDEGDYLIDFIGIIVAVHKHQDVDCDGKINKVVILDIFSHGKKIQCNVFGDSCELLDFNLLMNYKRSPLVVLQSFKKKILGDYVCLPSVINISRVLINPDIEEAADFLKEYEVASKEFSRLSLIGDHCLVCNVDDEVYDWKSIRNVRDIKSNCENGVYYVIGVIHEIADDTSWWICSCVCGHVVVQRNGFYHCDMCASRVYHVVVRFRMKIVIGDGTSIAVVDFLDSAVTKLIGKTCFAVLKQMEEEISCFSKVPFRYSPQVLHKLIAKEKMLKVEISRPSEVNHVQTFEVVDVVTHKVSKPGIDRQSNDVINGPVFPPIFYDYIDFGLKEDYKNQILIDACINSKSLQYMMIETLSSEVLQFVSQVDSFALILGTLTSVLKNQKWWFSSCLCGAPVNFSNGISSCIMCQLELLMLCQGIP